MLPRRLLIYKIYSAQTVGVIFKTERDSFRVLDQNSQIRLVQPHQISMRRDSHKAIATDSEGHELRVNDNVKEIDNEVRFHSKIVKSCIYTCSFTGSKRPCVAYLPIFFRLFAQSRYHRKRRSVRHACSFSCISSAKRQYR